MRVLEGNRLRQCSTQSALTVEQRTGCMRGQPGRAAWCRYRAVGSMLDCGPSLVGHGFLYCFAASADACRGGDESVGLSNGDGDQFFECAEDMSEPVGEGHPEVLVFERHGDEFVDTSQREVDLSSVQGDNDFDAADGY